jgi:hypothetical protein
MKGTPLNFFKLKKSESNEKDHCFMRYRHFNTDDCLF